MGVLKKTLARGVAAVAKLCADASLHGQSIELSIRDLAERR